MEIDYSKVMDKVKFWRAAIERSKDFSGTSPPSVFVGRHGYPRVFVGVLAPPVHQEKKEAAMLDAPEKWYKKRVPLEQILNFRGQMIYSRFRSPVSEQKGKLLETTQEISMVRKPPDIEVELKKQPRFNMKFDSRSTPVGSPAPIQKVVLTENPSIERKVDYIVSDMDMKAEDAVNRLYDYGIPVSRIQKIFSTGLLGVRVQRKLVPTRWSITAVDDIIGKNIVKNVKKYQQLGEYRVFSNEYLGNHYEIILIPAAYEYELVEAWDLNSPNPKIGSDHEKYWLRKKYANNTHGAFYSGRLGVGEYLDRIKRQAAALIVREVRPDYYAPLGIWQLRETVRGAFEKPYESFDTLNKSVDRVCSRLMVGRKWIPKSELIKDFKEQTMIKQFLNV